MFSVYLFPSKASDFLAAAYLLLANRYHILTNIGFTIGAEIFKQKTFYNS
jgi:hypothetical protein